MGQFLVRLSVNLPVDMDAHQRDILTEQELHRGRELRTAGILRHIWRLPGENANVGIWQARDAAELHDAICSLPLWPWMTVTVRALAPHPLYLGED